MLPKTGVEYGREFETREAAKFAGIPWQEFQAMPGRSRVAVVAHYRAAGLLEAILNEKANRKIKQVK